MSTRKVFGRRKGIEIPGHEKVFTIEMTKTDVRFRQRSCRKVEIVPFERIVNGGGLATKVGGSKFTFTLTAEGVEVKRSGVKGVRVVPFHVIANEANEQPMLFPELVKEEEK